MHQHSDVLARIRRALDQSDHLSQSTLAALAQVLTDVKRSQQAIERTKQRLAESKPNVLDGRQRR